MRYLLFFIALFSFVSAGPYEDRSVVRGKLENGLTYYVKQNAYPDTQAYLMLVVKAGSIHESPEELGYAHLVEHLVFRGSSHFKDGEVIRYLDSLGAWNGEDSNAVTGFDSTCYHFMIPLDDKEALFKTLLILSDFASSATISEEVVRKEKGVVLDEYHRGNSSADMQRMYKRIKEFLPQTPFAERFPIGTEKSIQNVSSNNLRKFYQKWYTPDRMAVIAVGDFEPEVVTGAIKRIFGSIPYPTETTSEPIFEIKLPNKSQALIHVDPDLTATKLEIVGYELDLKKWTAGNDFLDTLVMALTQNRVLELSKKHSNYFSAAGFNVTHLGMNVFELKAAAYIRHSPCKAAEILYTEIKKIEKEGFTEAELKKVKGQLEKELNKDIKNIDRQDHTSFGDRMALNFLKLDVIASQEQLLKHHLDALENVTMNELNAFLKTSLNPVRMIFISTPEKIMDFDESDLLAIIEKQDLVEGEITAIDEEEEYGITYWTLNNGISISLKPSKLERQQVEVRAVASGGFSASASPEEYMTSQLLIPYVFASGFGEFNHEELADLNENEKLSFDVSLDHTRRSITASGNKQDLKKIFEILHAFFSSPTFNPAIWSSLNEHMTKSTLKALNDPTVRFNNFLDKIYSNDNFRVDFFDASQAEESLSQELFDRFFGAPQAFHFSIVGDFSLEEVEPLIKTYLGSLSDQSPKTISSTTIIELPKETIHDEFIFGKLTNTKTVIGYVYNTRKTTPDTKSLFVFALMKEIVQRRIHSLLREDLGQTYNVAVTDYGPLDTNESNSVLQISFTAQEDYRKMMIEHALDAIEKLKENAISKEELLIAQQTLVQAYKKMERSNRYWVSTLNSLKEQTRASSFCDYKSNIFSITEEDIEEMIHTVFDESYPSVISHLPAVRK